MPQNRECGKQRTWIRVSQNMPPLSRNKFFLSIWFSGFLRCLSKEHSTGFQGNWKEFFYIYMGLRVLKFFHEKIPGSLKIVMAITWDPEVKQSSLKTLAVHMTRGQLEFPVRHTVSRVCAPWMSKGKCLLTSANNVDSWTIQNNPVKKINYWKKMKKIWYLYHYLQFKCSLTAHAIMIYMYLLQS